MYNNASVNMKQKNRLARLDRKKFVDENMKKPEEQSCKSLLLHALPSLNDSFVIRRKIGEGAFSSVYAATLVNCPDTIVAIKHLIPTSHPNRIEMELECMQRFGGRNNVMEVYSCFRQGSHFVMIMPYFRHNKFPDFVDKMDLNEIRHYLRSLLEALDCVHEGGVIHRDVKPSNVLYNRKLRRCALIDFGLAQYVDALPSPMSKRLNIDTDKIEMPTSKRLKGCSYERTIGSCLNHSSSWAHNGQSSTDAGSASTPSAKAFLRLVPSARGLNNPHLTIRSSSIECECFGRDRLCKTCLQKPQQTAARAGTPGYRSPEVLLKQRQQTTAVDIWAVGVIFLSLLCKRYPLFEAHDDVSALAEIMSLFGTDPVRKFAAIIGKTVTCSPELPSHDLAHICDELGRHRSRSASTPETDNDWSAGYDLLDKLLALDPNLRISAADALRHPFFSASTVI